MDPKADVIDSNPLRLDGALSLLGLNFGALGLWIALIRILRIPESWRGYLWGSLTATVTFVWLYLEGVVALKPWVRRVIATRPLPQVKTRPERLDDRSP